MVVPYVWILDALDAPKPRTCQTVGSGLCETVGGLAQAVGSGRWRAGAASLWILDASDAPKPRTCQTVGSGLCETVGGVAQAVAETALQTPQTPQTPQTLRHLPMVVPYIWILDASDAPWMLQTLQNLALARLWSLGSARIRRSKTSHLPDCGLWALRDCGRSCAGCGLVWALRDCGRSCAGCGLGALARRSSQPLDSGRFRRSKTSHLPDCGLWALRDCGRSCAGCGLRALARQILFF